jgi:hypothetical protein
MPRRPGRCCAALRELLASSADVLPAELPERDREERVAVSVVYLLLADVPLDGVERFQHYEAQVIPLLLEHGGQLERQLRSADACTEAHIVRFPSEAHFASYRDDPRRADHQQILRDSGAQVVLHKLFDV